jgi:endonuclease VIII
MPEGPSILLVRETLHPFIGKKVLAAQGNSKIAKDRLKNQIIRDILSWGKHLLICFDDFTVRIHFLMFGTYLVNERKSTPLRLSLVFKKGEINFYTASIVILEDPLDEIYDFRADVLSETWSPRLAAGKLKGMPDENVCDVLLDQQIFSGVGNIIKNEVLFRVRVHPRSRIGGLPPAVRSKLIREARLYSQDFLKWKRAFVLKKHWLVYTKKICPRDGSPIQKAYLGKGERRSFFCETCQLFYP